MKHFVIRYTVSKDYTLNGQETRDELSCDGASAKEVEESFWDEVRRLMLIGVIRNVEVVEVEQPEKLSSSP